MIANVEAFHISGVLGVSIKRFTNRFYLFIERSQFLVTRSKLLKNKSELQLSTNWELRIKALLLVSLTIIQGYLGYLFSQVCIIYF